MARSPIQYAGTCLFISLTASICFGQASQSSDADWPQFRGADATGVANDGMGLPTKWSQDENVRWVAEIKGRGWSSPIVTRGRVYLTNVVNFGESEEPKKGLYFGGNRPDPPKSEHVWQVICYDAQSGDELWNREVHRGSPETSIHLKNSFASETPVTDGKRLYVAFGGVGIYCFDLDGQLLWEKPLSPYKTRFGWGTAASPVVYEDVLYFVDDNDENSSLLALDTASGEELWRVERDEKSNWATPYIWKHDQGTEIVTPGSGRVRAYALDGTQRWSFSGMSSITIATPYVHQGLLIVSSGYVGDDLRPIYAIRPGAQGDIGLQDKETSNEFIAWSNRKAGPYNPTTVSYQGTLYVLYDRGIMAAYDAQTGAEVYSKKRIPQGGAFTSSPWAYDGNIYCLNENGETFVIPAGSEFEVSHVNSLGEDDMGMATPAIAGKSLFIRTSARLYCIEASH